MSQQIQNPNPPAPKADPFKQGGPNQQQQEIEDLEDSGKPTKLDKVTDELEDVVIAGKTGGRQGTI
jgi:hypothetical protein